MRVTQFFLEISWISTCVSLFHPVFCKSLLLNRRNPSMTMSKKKILAPPMKIIQDSQKGLKVTDGWWCGRFHLPQKKQMVLSEIQGLSIFVNDQESELDVWNDQNRRTWNSLSWLSRIHDTFFSETCWFVHSSESWILGFRLKVGSSNAFGMEVRSKMVADLWRISCASKIFWSNWNLKLTKSTSDHLFYLKPFFFFVLNQRWCEQWKNGQLGCFGLYRGGTFWLYLGCSWQMENCIKQGVWVI